LPAASWNIICRLPKEGYGDELFNRYVDGRLAQTTTIISEADDRELADNSLDAAMLVLTMNTRWQYSTNPSAGKPTGLFSNL
jgi:hypothetical protein